MSGSELRHSAQLNNHEKLRQLLAQRANACSTDEHGLSALHYAVWNGAVECVKLLVMNPLGVDRSGQHCNCLTLTTSLGYTGEPSHLPLTHHFPMFSQLGPLVDLNI